MARSAGSAQYSVGCWGREVWGRLGPLVQEHALAAYGAGAGQVHPLLAVPVGDQGIDRDHVLVEELAGRGAGRNRREPEDTCPDRARQRHQRVDRQPLVRNRARTLIYSTGLPPAILAFAIAALDLIEHEPHRLALPLAKARAFTEAAGLPAAQSAIVPVVIGAASAALAASQLLEAEGYLAVAIRPPTVPEGTQGCDCRLAQRIPTPTLRTWPILSARAFFATDQCDLHHRDWDRHRQNLRHSRSHPALAFPPTAPPRH